MRAEGYHHQGGHIGGPRGVMCKVHREEVKTPWFCFENSQLTAQPNRAEEDLKNSKQWRENYRR